MTLEKARLTQTRLGGEDGRIEPFQVPDLQHPAGSGGNLDERARLFQCLGHGLFNQHMCSGTQKVCCDGVMGRSLGNDAHRIDLAQQLLVIGKSRHTQLCRNRIAGALDTVYHSHQLTLRQGGIFLGVEPAEVAHTDHGGSDFLHGAAIMPRVSKSIPPDKKSTRKGKSSSLLAYELRALALAVALGVLVLPSIIWVCGHLVIGDYVRDPLTGSTGGPLALTLDYLQALAQGSTAHWILAAGPYGLFLVWRALRRLLIG